MVNKCNDEIAINIKASLAFVSKSLFFFPKTLSIIGNTSFTGKINSKVY